MNFYNNEIEELLKVYNMKKISKISIMLDNR